MVITSLTFTKLPVDKVSIDIANPFCTNSNTCSNSDKVFSSNTISRSNTAFAKSAIFSAWSLIRSTSLAVLNNSSMVSWSVVETFC